MKRNRFPLAFAVLMGCVGDVNSDSNDTAVGVDPDDTSDPSDYVNVTVHAAIDGEPIDPVGVCIHESSGKTGDEATLAQAETTGKAILVPLFEGGTEARAWIGAASAEKSTDGYRVLDFDGRQWVHPLADFTISEDGCTSPNDGAMKMVKPIDCEATVNLNGYFPPTEFHCVADTYWYDESEPDHKGEYVYTEEGDHRLEVTSGKDIVDVDENGLDGILASGCSLESSGTTFVLNCTGDVDQWVVDSSWNSDGFSVSVTEGEAFTEYTCTVK